MHPVLLVWMLILSRLGSQQNPSSAVITFVVQWEASHPDLALHGEWTHLLGEGVKEIAERKPEVETQILCCWWWHVSGWDEPWIKGARNSLSGIMTGE